MTRLGSWGRKLWEDFFNVFVPSRNAIRVLPENESLFGETLVAQRRTVISINSAFGISRLRQSSTITGSASADTTQKGKIILQTGATAGSGYKLASSEVGQYAPGFGAEVGVGVRLEQTLEGTAFARFGGLSTDGENGLYVRVEANDAILAVRRSNNIEVDRVPLSEWNLDRFDGTGPSGVDVNLTNGYIWQTDFSWYGYGLILYGLARASPDSPEVQHFIPGHYIQVEGDISIQEPNLQIIAEINNGDQATSYALNVGGMQYSTVGQNSGARKRTVDDYVFDVTGVGTGYTHLITFERKPTFLNRSFEIESIEAVVASERVCFELWLGGTVTGGTYDTPTGYEPTETSIESVREQSFDTTGAILLYRKFVEPGTANKAGSSEESVIDLDLPTDGTLTLTARTLSGTATVNLALMRGMEGW